MKCLCSCMVLDTLGFCKILANLEDQVCIVLMGTPIERDVFGGLFRYSMVAFCAASAKQNFDHLTVSTTTAIWTNRRTLVRKEMEKREISNFKLIDPTCNERFVGS